MDQAELIADYNNEEFVQKFATLDSSDPSFLIRMQPEVDPTQAHPLFVQGIDCERQIAAAADLES